MTMTMTTRENSAVTTFAAESTSSTTTTATTAERLLFCFISVILGSIPMSSSSPSQQSSSESLFLCAISLTVGVFMIMMVPTPSPQQQQQQQPSSSSHSSEVTLTKVATNKCATNDKAGEMATTKLMMRYYHWTAGLCLVTIPFRVWTQLAIRDFTSTLSVLLVVWNTDTGALVVGRLCSTIKQYRQRQQEKEQEQPQQQQQHSRRTATDTGTAISKVLEVPEWILRISPKKTMEGFVGGYIGGMLTATVWIPWIIRTFGPTITTTFPPTTCTIDPALSYEPSICRLRDINLDSNVCWFWGMTTPGPWIERTNNLLCTETYTTNAAAYSSSYFRSFLQLEPTSEFSWLWGTGTSNYLENIPSGIEDDDGMLRKLLLGFVLATLAIVGDLVESSIKRRSSSKDSGKMLPGHGGVLDRFDSSLLAVVVYQAFLNQYPSYS